MNSFFCTQLLYFTWHTIHNQGENYLNWHSRLSAFYWTNFSFSSKIGINSHITIEFDFTLRYIFPWFRILRTNVRLHTVKMCIVPVTSEIRGVHELTFKSARHNSMWGLGRPFGLKGTRYEGHTAESRRAESGLPLPINTITASGLLFLQGFLFL